MVLATLLSITWPLFVFLFASVVDPKDPKLDLNLTKNHQKN
jgi:hypothetical protein